MKSAFKKQAAALVVSASALTGTAAMAAIDLSPWKNPIGPNLGLETDITLSGSPTSFVPVQVNVSVCNRGDETVTSDSFAPIQVRLLSPQANLTTDGDFLDIKSLADGTPLAPNACANLSFSWTPDFNQGVTEIQALVNPTSIISDINQSNDLATLAVAVDGEPVIPALSCNGFFTPFDGPKTIKKKAKGTIPVKMKLQDEFGIAVTTDSLYLDFNDAPAPVINVTFNGVTYGESNTEDAALESIGSSNDGNIFDFNDAEQLWEYRLGTKQFRSSGTYVVTVRSGDESKYTIDTGNNSTCAQTFTRQ